MIYHVISKKHIPAKKNIFRAFFETFLIVPVNKKQMVENW